MILSRRRAVTTQFNNPVLTYATLDPVTAYRMVLSNGNITFQPSLDTPNYFAVARSTSAKNSGKYYIECHRQTISVPANFRIGVSLEATTPASISTNVSLLLGSNMTSGEYSYVGCAIDIDTGKVFVGSKLGSFMVWHGGQNPVTGANPKATFTPGSLVRVTVRPYYLDYYGSDSYDSGTLKLAPTTHLYAPPSGYTAGWPM